MIKKFFSLFVLFWSATAFSAETKDLEDVIEEANKAVVNVIAELEGNEQNLGAGIIIGSDGYIVTNAHVTEGAKKIFATTNRALNDFVFATDLFQEVKEYIVKHGHHAVGAARRDK